MMNIKPINAVSCYEPLTKASIRGSRWSLTEENVASRRRDRKRREQTGLLRVSQAGAEPVPRGGWNPPGRRKEGDQPRAAGPEPGGVKPRDSSS